MPKSFRSSRPGPGLPCAAGQRQPPGAGRAASTASSRRRVARRHHWRLQALQLPHGRGGYAGFDVDMAQRLAENLGAKLVVVPTSWPNLMRDFADDRFDIAMSGISINLERQRQAYFSIPLPARRQDADHPL